MSFFLTEEYDDFQADRSLSSNYYILKPAVGSCGRGIKIVDSKSNISVSNREGMIASHYIMNPHLINGLKYDLRVYVLVTSYCPLKVYIYNDGLVRFATELYSLDPKKINHKYIHLTNFSINKNNKSKFVNHNDEVESDNEDISPDSSKWDFK